VSLWKRQTPKQKPTIFLGPKKKKTKKHSGVREKPGGPVKGKKKVAKNRVWETQFGEKSSPGGPPQGEKTNPPPFNSRGGKSKVKNHKQREPPPRSPKVQKRRGKTLDFSGQIPGKGDGDL